MCVLATGIEREKETNFSYDCLKDGLLRSFTFFFLVKVPKFCNTTYIFFFKYFNINIKNIPFA